MKRNIYSIFGDTPEVTAYGMAKYSRSSMSLMDSIAEISEKKAKEFLDTFYFQYGHGSIADLAHVAIAIENISIWAAMVIVDEPLWDGQERSTRYQDFKKTSYFLPNDAPRVYDHLAQSMFDTYYKLTDVVKGSLEEKYERPDIISEEAYHRTLRARAFDVSRYWLPLSTRTSLGQIVNARTLERQISRLLSHRLPEIKEIAQELKEAVLAKKPINSQKNKLDKRSLSIEAGEIFNQGPLLPTLAKYMDENLHATKTRDRLKEVANDLLGGLTPKSSYGVELYTFDSPLDHACTVLLYSVSNLSYSQIKEVVSRLEISIKNEILDIVFYHRGKHDGWLRELQSHPLIFDITMDIGSFRDLNRHRKVTKVLQEPDTMLGFAVPDILKDVNLVDEYTIGMKEHFSAIEKLKNEWDSLQSRYLLPLGTLCRSLHQMDIHEAAYIIELRTGSAGHFSYREITYQMYEKLAEVYPEFTKYIRVTNPREVFNPFQR